MKERNIGDIRLFERYPGQWEIIKIIKDKNICFDLILKSQKCPYCGGVFGDKKIYCFNYIEMLKNENVILHLGISNDEPPRWVIFEDYLNKEIISLEVDNVY